MVASPILASCTAALATRRRATTDLRARIYRAVYASGWDGFGKEPGRRPTALIDRDFVDSIRCGITCKDIQEGWRVLSNDDEVVIVEQDGIRVAVCAEDVVGIGEEGEPVSIKIPSLRAWRLPGFVSRSTLPGEPPPLTRIYVNTRPRDGRWLLSALAESLTGEAIPYFMKVLAHPGRYHRADSGLVMVPSSSEGAALGLVEKGIVDANIYLGRATPALTKRHAKGIGVADDPDDLPLLGDRVGSYGEWVATWLHEAIEGTEEPSEAAARMANAITAAGRGPDSPHRRRSRADDL